MLRTRSRVLASSLLLAAASSAVAQDLLVVESNFKSVLRIDGTDGQVLDPVLLNLNTSTGTKPKLPTHATEVGDEIWISDAAADTVFRFDPSGQYLGELPPGLDQPGAMLVLEDEVLVTNTGAGGAGYGNALVRYAPDGTFVGTFDVSASAVPAFLYPASSYLVVADSAGHDLELYTYSGNYAGTLHDSDGVTGIDTPAQIVSKPDGFGHHIYVAGTGSPSGIYEYNASGGPVAFLDTESLGFGGVRGLHPLRNGHFLFTNAEGIHVLDPATNAVTTVYGGVVCHFVGRLKAGLPDGVTLYCGPDQNPNNAAGFWVDTVDLSAPYLTMVCSDGPPGQSVILIVGDNNVVIHQPPGNEGDLCVAGGSCLGRYSKDLRFFDAYGQYSIDIQNALSNPCGGGALYQPGATWYFQFWHRQPMGQPSAFSTAAAVTFQ